MRRCKMAPDSFCERTSIGLPAALELQAQGIALGKELPGTAHRNDSIWQIHAETKQDEQRCISQCLLEASGRAHSRVAFSKLLRCSALGWDAESILSLAAAVGAVLCSRASSPSSTACAQTTRICFTFLS